MRSPDRVSAILMGSGFSRRFGGENKLLVPFRGKPLARHTLELVCGLNKDPNGGDSPFFCNIFFITADEQTDAIAAGLPVTLIRNGAPQNGRRESVRLGLEAADKLKNRPDYYFFFPCDQPLLDTETVRLIMAARQSGKIVEPCFHGEADSLAYGSPSLFSAAFREELLSLEEGEQPNVIKARHPNALIKVEIANPLALIDIDTPEDIEKYS